MQYYQIKSTERGSQPVRWYRLLVPSGITFSQLYILLSYVHGEYPFISNVFYYSTTKNDVIIEEFIDGEPENGQSLYDKYDATGTYIDTFFKKGVRINQFTGRDFDLIIQIEEDKIEYPELVAPKVLKYSRAIAEEEGGQFTEGIIPEELFVVEQGRKNRFRSVEELDKTFGADGLMYCSSNPKTPNESICEGMIHELQRTMDQVMSTTIKERPVINAATTYSKVFCKADLEAIAKDLKLVGYNKLSQAELAKKIADSMLNPEYLADVLTQLQDDEIALLLDISSEPDGILPKNEDDERILDELVNNLLAFRLTNGRMHMPDDLRNLVGDIWNDELEIKRQKRVWMFKCLKIAVYFYGVMTWDVLGQLFSRKFKNISAEELRKIYYSTPEYYNDFTIYDGRLMRIGYEEDNYYKNLELTMQRDKPFYIPSRREIDEFYEKDCLLSSPSHHAMYSFILRTFGCEKEIAELKVAELYKSINYNERLQDVVNQFEDDDINGKEGFVFPSEEAIRKFCDLYMEMNNNSHIISNRGYTPKDLYIFHS